MKIRVFCIQTNSSQFPSKNIEMLDNIFKRIKATKIDLICLPECVAIFSDEKKRINDFLLNWNDRFLDLIKYYSKKKNSYILIGSVPEKNKNNKFFNRSLIIDPQGKVVSSYDKINLFDVFLSNEEKYIESKNYDSGKKINLTKLPWGNLGMTICYDLRFPLLYKKLAKKGAHFFSIPAAFTYTTGISHWESLLRARAIENGCFVFAPAQCGYHDNGRRTFGNSMIIDPWGKILKRAKNSIGAISCDIDLEKVNFYRKRIPAMTEF